ncbi:MAG: shikimate dehydrogenase [Micromonosporaceae bacterium]|nr:shikimate dehydrogenase [Micromonosporaceae bacterium]
MRRAAVLGKPISHSLSPVIHTAGYVAAGLTGWSYTAYECAEHELASLVASLGPQWAGLSLTMPLKEAALRVADTVDPAAEALGAANTLVRGEAGWHAVNTDAPGIVGALRWAGVEQVKEIAVLGAGGTARAALAAAALLGARATVYARRPEAIRALARTAEALGVDLSGQPWSEVGECLAAEVVISTVPAGAADQLSALAWRRGMVLFDVIYHPWPTPVAAAATAAGARVVSGLDLLLSQALGQFELFTGVSAPVQAMGQALAAASKADSGAIWIK